MIIRDMGLAIMLEERAREARLLEQEYVLLPLRAVEPLQESLFLAKEVSQSDGDNWTRSRNWSLINKARVLLLKITNF